MSLTPAIIGTMLALQDSMNSKINPQWVTAGNAWHRAVVAEISECLDWASWKWWKKQDRNIPQLKIELIDIWHFLISDYIVRSGGDLQRAGNSLLAESVGHLPHLEFDGLHFEIDQMDLLGKIELLGGLSTVRRTHLYLFHSIMHDCGMDWKELTQLYCSKNVLNFFRADNGYKDGTYRKMWAGREDNDHLAEIMATLDATAADFSDQLYAALETRYRETA